jgi:ABC-type branched-subunit amino acid transport system ATPase component
LLTYYCKSRRKEKMDNANALEIRNLTKSFKGMYALNILNMTVPIGSIYGFIGKTEADNN